jgi:hypothetical protein
MEIKLSLSEAEATILFDHLGDLVTSETENGIILDNIFFRLGDELRMD